MKVIEYRTVPNSGGSVELRRVTPSVDGPVEHIDVVEPVHMPLDASGSRTSSRTSPRKWRSSLREKSSMTSSHRRPSSSASTAGAGRSSAMATSTPWLDFEGPPAQQHAWHNGNGGYGSTGHRRLAMNGSQPCLMVMSADQSNAHMHHQGGPPTFHHYYHHHLHPSADMSVYEADYMQAPMFHDGVPIPDVHGTFMGHQHAARLAGSQPCLFLGSETNQPFAQTPIQTDTQPRRKSSCRSSQKLSLDKRTRLKRSESFSVPATWAGGLPPPPPPVPQHLDSQLPTPSLSPLTVVRNKRANQVRLLLFMFRTFSNIKVE